MSRKPTDLPDTDEGQSERLRRALRRSQRVLNTELAQDPIAPEMGMLWHLTFHLDPETRTARPSALRRDIVDRALLDQAATLTRVFTLSQEAIHGPKVARAISQFATTQHLKQLADQLRRMWEDEPFTRTYTMMSIGGSSVTPEGGISDSSIGDRVLYSDLVHADDASAVLEHVSDDDQEWALTSLVGDRVALIAHQEWLIHSVRPDLCPSPTAWAGDHITIFRRLGSPIQDQDEAEPPGDQDTNNDRE